MLIKTKQNVYLIVSLKGENSCLNMGFSCNFVWNNRSHRICTSVRTFYSYFLCSCYPLLSTAMLCLGWGDFFQQMFSKLGLSFLRPLSRHLLLLSTSGAAWTWLKLFACPAGAICHFLFKGLLLLQLYSTQGVWNLWNWCSFIAETIRRK